METKLKHGPANSTRHRPVNESADTQALQVSVSILEGTAGLEKVAKEIDALNAVSERPNPFLSAGFLIAYSRSREYGTPQSMERLFLFHEGDRLIGCFPMLSRPDTMRVGNMSIRNIFRNLIFLGYIDTEQPAIVSAPKDQNRCAKALIDHLCNASDWDLIHLTGQLPGSALYAAAHAASGSKLRVRDIQVSPYNEIPIVWTDLPAYFRTLSQKMRSNISRQARKLYAAGGIQLVYAEGAQGTSAWFDAYCDLDSRSWKDGTESSLRRHPGRIGLYRNIVNGNGGFEPSFIGIVLNDMLVAGLLLGSNQAAAPHRHGLWCLEMAYDRAHSKLGPGQLLFLLAMEQAIDRKHRHLNFMQNFDYYKHRWGATPINVVDVQILRRFSARNAVAKIAELRRWFQKMTSTAKPAGAATNEDVTTSPEVATPLITPEQRNRAQQLARQAMVSAGNNQRILDRNAARHILPFDIG